jgi:carbon storage regulator CsrA
MLVLSRKKNEGITIDHPDGEIHIKVVEIRGDKVRLAFSADPTIIIHRDEVHNAIQKKNVLA